jgi:signal transduction histidine kinase
MIRLVEDMLDASRLESRKFKIHKSPIRLDEIAKKTLDELSRLAGLKEQAVSLAVKGRLSEINGDDRRIKQVFDNLLTNAIKYTPAKGRIEVTIEEEPTQVRISIADDGIGIDSKDQHKLFQKFYTGSGSSLTREPGRMGLGLAIAKGIVEAHEGRIWVESEIAKGSRFIFTLPKHV